MMPKKRDREREDPAKKRFRQSTLDSHFSFEDKVEQGLEEEPLEGDMSLQMSAEERADLQRRRDLMAAAAERRKQAESPWTTPPHSPEDSQSERNGALSNLAPSTSGASPTTRLKSSMLAKRENNMVAKQAQDSADPKQARTSTSGDNVSVTGQQRTEMYDHVLDIANKEFEIGDHELPSTSRDRLPRLPVEMEGGFEDGEEDSRERRALEEAQQEDEMSQTLQYDGSQPLFTDSEPSGEDQVEAMSNNSAKDSYWKGSPISELNRAPDCLVALPEMRPSEDHTILFRPSVKSDVPPRPFPDDYQDVWDSDHVRMPCSPENLYPVEDQDGQKKVQSRWELIEATLLSGIKNSLDLEEAILTYNARYSQRWNFRALHVLFTEVLDADETVYFFDIVLPEMVHLALQLPKLCTQAVPLLRRQRTHSITITQQQVASLLANAFFCTFPRRNAQQKKSEYSRFPDINFNRLFEMGKGYKNIRKIEKLKCILNYFRRVTAKVPTGTISISRQSLTDMPRWDKSTTTLSQIHMAAAGTIETEGHGMLQMDFANKYIGGGALGCGCVQEEIRFMICPELIVTRLLTEVLDDNECVIIKGVEQFSSYSGYANSFLWRGNINDRTPRDSWGRRETEIVAIDALVIRRYEDQFRPDCLRRELNKAFCGFYGNQASPEHLPAVATGNWGCGAFGGDTRVKGLLQLMAAAESGRDLAYFTFGDKELCDDMVGMHEFLTSQAVTVGDLWRNLHRYRTDVLRRSAGTSKPKLFSYLYQLYTTCDSDTDEYEPDHAQDADTKKQRGQSLSPNYQAETP